MRIRSIKPEFWRSDDVNVMEIEDRLLFIGLWSYVDDNGVGIDRISDICADLFAHDLSVSPHGALMRVQTGLNRLHALGVIVRYRVGVKQYLEISNWEKHQKINRPSPGRYPKSDEGEVLEPEPFSEDSVSPHNTLSAGTGEQGNRGTVKNTPSTAPRSRATEPDPEAEIAEALPFERSDEIAVLEEEPEPTPEPEPRGFPEFWATYPRKVGKKSARAKYRTALKRATAQEILEGAHRLATDPNLPEHKYIPHPETWLNRDGWEDERLPVRSAGRSGERLAAGASLVQRAGNRHQNNDNPFEKGLPR